ncbi:MAG: hypothetical protein R3B84_06535 [Zavarzinella sp.]
MLLLIFAIISVSLAVVLWLLSLILQAWLYNDVAKMLPVRALIAGITIAGFLTIWCAIYRADPGRFDTLFNFSRLKNEGTYTEFQSVRKVGNQEKPPKRYVREPGTTGKTSEFYEENSRRTWQRSDADGMVVAILINEEGKSTPTRFEAELTPDGKFPSTGLRYVELNGSRYLEEKTMGDVWRVRSWSLLGNLFMNGFHAILWVLVCWLGLRFTFGNAVGLGLPLWLVTMIVVQPFLFQTVTK